MQRSFPRRTNFYKAFTTSIFEGFLNYRGRYVSRELPLFQMAQRIGIFFVTHIYIYNEMPTCWIYFPDPFE